MSHTLRLENVEIGRGAAQLFPALDLAVAAGQITTLMGPSGSGKSTLLAYVCGTLDRAFKGRGRILVDEVDITLLPPERRGVGILFQDDLLFPHLSVGGNLAFGLTGRMRGRAARRARIEKALAEADLAGFADRDPATLSGGQRARVAVLRVLLSEPKVLLLDEPFGRLDVPLREGFRRFVYAHAAARNLPTLQVTHDLADATAANGPILHLLSSNGSVDRAEIPHQARYSEAK